MVFATAGFAEGMTADDERALLLFAAFCYSIYPFFLLQLFGNLITLAGGIQFLVYCCAAGAVIRSYDEHDEHEWVRPMGVLGLLVFIPVVFVLGGWFFGLLPVVALITLVATGLKTPETSKATKVKLATVPIAYVLLNITSNFLLMIATF